MSKCLTDDRCTESARLSIPGGFLRDRRASVLSPLNMALGEQVLELHEQGPATLCRKRRHDGHRFSGNSHRGSLAESQHQCDVGQG